MAVKKKQVFQLPIKLILTEEGENFFFKNNKKMMRFKMADGSSAYGISLPEYSISSIQRMLQMDYISAVEMTSSNFTDSRHEIIDFSKLVMYSRFYKKFNDKVYMQFCKSEMVRLWNRSNPANLVTEDKRPRDEIIRKSVTENPDTIKTVQSLIMRPIQKRINEDLVLSPEEKNIHILFSEKLVGSLNSVIWFILMQNIDQKDYRTMTDFIADHIFTFLKKSDIPEYFALMFMELLALTENTKLKNYAAKELGQDYNIDQILADDSIRKMLLLKTKNDNIYVSWKIKSHSVMQTSGPEQIEVTIYDRETKYRSMKEKINVQKDLDLKEKSLTDFYSHSQKGGGNELGLFYLSYLDEACRKVDMRFESNVSYLTNDDLTVITLKIII